LAGETSPAPARFAELLLRIHPADGMDATI
jgi:hypothetical protein